MAFNQDIGKKGEDKAAEFLVTQGYEILARNYRSGRSEIDIIAIKNSLLVFVEVKIRSSIKFGYPESFVTDQQADRIMQGASEYQFQNNWTGNIRFDIISIERDGEDMKIQHFKDALH